jgi:hypothetical protein
MSAQFVSLAVGYSLALGQLRRKGIRKRPWLELRRLETESTYLEHQVRALRRSLRQPLRVDTDLLPGKGYYDISRARIHSPWLERALEILEDGITEDALLVAGNRGLACLWLDRGFWRGQSGELTFASESEAEAFRAALHHLWIQPKPPLKRPRLVRLPPDAMHDLAAVLRPHVHRSMRHTLRPGGLHGIHLLR